MENELESIKAYREFFANYIVRSVVGSKNEALIAAFSEVERERFVGKEPWQVADGSTYLPTGSDDPRLLYRDILIGLVPDRGINNGQPSLCVFQLIVDGRFRRTWTVFQTNVDAISG